MTALFPKGCCAGSCGGSGDTAQHSLLVLSVSLIGIDFAEQPIHDLERQHAKVMAGDLFATMGGFDDCVDLLVEVGEERRAQSHFVRSSELSSVSDPVSARVNRSYS